MKPDRNKPKVVINRKARSLELRTRNQVIVLDKQEMAQNMQVVRLTFLTATPYYKDNKLVDEWLHGTSRFNIAITRLAMSEHNLVYIFELLKVFHDAFEAPKTPKIEIVKH